MFLTMAEKTTLIKSTLNFLPNHIMQYFHIPTNIINKLNRYQRNFLWGTTDIRKKLHLLKWEQITTPTIKGGLSIQNLRTKNYASLASLAWRTF